MPILFDERFRILTADQPLTYLDAGARGGLQGPWRVADDGRLRVVSFEPDAAGAGDLRPGERHVVIAKGLWNRECEVDLHLAETMSTSSVHPPNWELLARFRRQHADPRRTVRKERIRCTTVDRVAAELGTGFDFMKIDTQGAEYEILEGAKEQLQRDVFAVLCETWTQPVHAGQRLTHEVWALLEEMGFEVVQTSIAAAWQHRVVDAHAVSGRAHLVGLDLLAFRKPAQWQRMTPERALKWAAIAELYGYPDIALDLLAAAVAGSDRDAAALDYFRKAITSGGESSEPAQQTLMARIRRIFRRPAGTKEVKLHY